MQKVLDLLERYVEWVALAIGGLFLLLMVFLYLLGTPISTKLGDRNVTLANVESITWNQSGSQLATSMTHSNVPTANVESYVDAFKKHMQNTDAAPAPTSAVVWVAAAGAPAAPLKHEDAAQQGETPKNVAGVPQDLPSPKYYGFSAGKSNVQTDPAKAVGMPMAGPPDMGAYGGMPPDYAAGGPPPGVPQGYGVPAWVQAQMGAPGAAPAAAPGAKPAEVAPGGTDKLWVTVAYTIPAEELAAAFEKAKVPAKLATVFLRLDPVRQELLPDGSWGNDTKIEPLVYHQVPAFPKGTVVEERVYADWASKNAMTLLAPDFYRKFAGDTWFAPGQPNPNKVADVRPVIQPGQFPGQMPGQIPGQNPRNIRRGGMPGGMPPDMGGMPGGRRGRTRYAPQDADRPSLPFLQGMPPEAVEAMRRAQEQAAAQGAAAAAAYGGGYGGPPDQYGMTGGPGFGRAQASVPEGYKVPAGTFNPTELDSDIFVWFHDDTVQPGKTYRYKMSYRIRNPLHGMEKVAEKPEAAKVFAISSPESDWSDAIKVDPISRFFVASGVSSGSTSVRMDVFKWQDGKWHMKQFVTSPGDMIGLVDDKIDYQTGWTLADLNANAISREPVIVADPRGQLGTRSFQGDQGQSGTFEKEIGWKDPNAPVRPAPGMMGPDGVPYGGPPADFVPPGPYGPYGR